MAKPPTSASTKATAGLQGDRTSSSSEASYGKEYSAMAEKSIIATMPSEPRGNVLVWKDADHSPKKSRS